MTKFLRGNIKNLPFNEIVLKNSSAQFSLFFKEADESSN